MNRFAAGNCCRVIFYSVSFGRAPFTVAGGPQVEADTAFFIPENRVVVPSAITGLQVHATGMNELRMSRLSVALFDPFVMYSGVGDIALTPGDDGLTALVGRAGAGALDVTCGDVDECALTLVTWNGTRWGSSRRYDIGMCRNIRPLYNFDPPVSSTCQPSAKRLRPVPWWR